MRKLGALAFLAAAIAVVGGCGGSSDSAASKQATTTATPPAFDVETTLIGLSELPTGWAKDPDDGKSADFCGLKGGVTPAMKVAGATATARANYSQGGSIPALTTAVYAFPPGGATAAMAVLRKAIASCAPSESDGVKLTPKQVSFPAMGDESVPLMFTAETQGFNFAAYQSFARVGDGITGISYSDLGTPDVTEAVKYANLAVAKLRAAQR